MTAWRLARSRRCATWGTSSRGMSWLRGSTTSRSRALSTLTTMHVPLDELGSRAVDRLIGRLSGSMEDVTLLEIVPELVVRATTRGRA